MSLNSFFTLRAPPGSIGWDLLDSDVRDIWTLRNELDQTQWLPAAEIERRQLAGVRALIAHCLENVPFYRDRLSAAGIVPDKIQTLDDFRRLPILSRQDCVEHAADLKARRLPAGCYEASRSSTSGATGQPLTVFQTNHVRRWWRACNLRDLEWSGFNPHGVLAALRPPPFPMNADHARQFRDGMVLLSWFPELDDLLESGLSHGMDLREDHRKQIEWLRRVAPNYLISYPSALEVLASYFHERGERLPSLRAIQTVSETLTEEARERIETVFGVPIKNNYSCAEAGYIASPCPDGRGMHVHAEHVLLEVLDENDQPCAPGQRGRVVLTTLHNYLSPFLRYEAFDEAVPAAPCPCGRGLPLLAHVEGKRAPYFHLADGRLKHSSAMVFAVYAVGGMRQYQLIQRADASLLLRVVPDQSWTAGHAERLERAGREFLESGGQVEVQVLDHLERSPGHKLQAVICEVSP